MKMPGLREKKSRVGGAAFWQKMMGTRPHGLSAILLPVWIGFVMWASAVNAETPPAAAPDFTLEEAVSLAVRDNANLQRMRSQWEAMQERPAQAGALNNPMFYYGGMDMASGGTWPNTDEKYYMVQQDLPWFGKRGLRKGIAIQDAEIMRLEWVAMTRDVVMQVKESYFDLVAVREVISILREEDAVMQRIATVAETQYATGERTQVDVLTAQTERTLLKQRLLDFQAQENTLQTKLNTLLNRKADRPFGVRPPPLSEIGLNGTVETLLALAATNRPEVLATQAQVERYELERKLMARESVPDYKLGVEYRDMGADDDMVMFSIGVDLPIWRAKTRAGVREAEKMRESSQAAHANAEQISALEVQDASFKLQTARRTLDLYRTELIPQAKARFNASEGGYRAGKVEFMDLLESERALLEAKMMAAMAEATVGMQAARLERAVGIDLGSGSFGEDIQ
jgi:outer membrane protein TolC